MPRDFDYRHYQCSQSHLGRAGLINMGGYGHSRFREFVMGGVTRDMLKHVEILTLLSH